MQMAIYSLFYSGYMKNSMQRWVYFPKMPVEKGELDIYKAEEK
jgi:hypothetical protein